MQVWTLITFAPLLTFKWTTHPAFLTILLSNGNITLQGTQMETLDNAHAACSDHHRWMLSLLNKAMPASSAMWLKDVLHDLFAKQVTMLSQVGEEKVPVSLQIMQLWFSFNSLVLIVKIQVIWYNDPLKRKILEGDPSSHHLPALKDDFLN